MSGWSFCPECGTDLPDELEANFCPGCGMEFPERKLADGAIPHQQPADDLGPNTSAEGEEDSQPDDEEPDSRRFKHRDDIETDTLGRPDFEKHPEKAADYLEEFVDAEIRGLDVDCADSFAHRMEAVATVLRQRADGQ